MELKLSIDVAWKPFEGSQQDFLTCPVFECLYSGTRGPGKTDTFIMDFAQHVGVGWGPEWRGVLFRQTYPQLSDVMSKCQKWFKKLFPDANYNKSERTWTFKDGEQLLLRHMLHEDDYWNYHGHAYPWIGFEELTNWSTPGCYTRMQSCCRSTVDPEMVDKFGRQMPRKLRATTNPYGPGHNWVKKRFRLPQNFGIVINDDVNEKGEILPARVAIQGHISENLVLLKAEPDYIPRLRSAARNKAEEEAWINGSWDITSGGMFDDIFETSIHVVDEFEIPATWKITRSFDWGSSKPFSVGWWAESDGSDVELPDGRIISTVRGDLFRVGEWYGTTGNTNEGLKLTAGEITKGVIKQEIELGFRNEKGISTRVKAGPADSSIWNDTGIGEKKNNTSIAKEMQKRQKVNGIMMPGVYFTKADKRPGSRKNGWEKIRQMLKASLPSEDGGPRESAGLFIFRNCRYWIELVPSLPRDDKDLDDVNTDAEDHIGDETRYQVMKEKRESRSGRQVGAH